MESNKSNLMHKEMHDQIVAQKEARIRELEERLETIYMQIEHIWDSANENILPQLDNVKGDICVTLDRNPKEKSNQSDTGDSDGNTQEANNSYNVC